MNHKAVIALQIDRLMRRFHADLHPHASKIDEKKIGPIGGMILFVIAESGTITSQGLAATLGRDKSQVSRIVNSLIRKNLIEKHTTESDARVSQLSLTKTGNMQVASFNGALVEATKSTLAPLNQDEIETFSKLLAKILNRKGPAS